MENPQHTSVAGLATTPVDAVTPPAAWMRLSLSAVAATLRFWRSAVCRWALLAALGWSLALHAWGLSPWGTVIDYTRAGTLGQWVSGIGSVLAVIVAVNSFVAGRRSIEARERDERDAKRTAVYAWLDVFYSGGRAAGLQVNFRNDTFIPVYGWVLHLEGVGDVHFCHLTSGPLLPGQSTRSVPPETVPIPPDPARLPRTHLIFAASNGQVWRRTYSGECSPVADASLSPLAHACL